MKKSHINIITARRIVAAVLLLITLPLILPANALKQSPKPAEKEELPKIEPQIPKVDRQKDKRVFLEHADLLKRAERDSFMIVTGNVEFSHGDMLMFCDSAHFYPESESFDAFGDVRMEQGDTLFVYASELNYRSLKHMAYLYGDDDKPVRMVNRNVTLLTPTFIYDMLNEFGYYTEGGELFDEQNRLTSIEGEYIPDTKEANFYTDVVLTSLQKDDTLHIYTDTLFYNTNTHIAELISPSTIKNKQATITTDQGTYNTDAELAELYNRSKVVASTGTTLEGDTLFYDRHIGIGEAFGNMEIVDTAHSVILNGDYGYYNEITDSAFATGRALAREYSQGDTLYMHAKYLYSFTVTDTTDFKADTVAGTEAYSVVDTTHVMVAHPRVRFYRTDMQGICDSMRFQERDSTLYMFHHPVVWSGERQIFGNVIEVELNDSTIEKATLPDFAFTAEHIEDKYFNQLAGKEMVAYFTGGELKHLDVNGNVQVIMLPQENDSTYNKIVNVESSFLAADFNGKALEKMKMWPQTSGTVTPLYLAKKSLFYLPQFKWYIDMRPTSAADVMIVPEAMDQLMSDIPPSSFIPPRRRINAQGKPETVSEETLSDTPVENMTKDEESESKVDETTPESALTQEKEM